MTCSDVFPPGRPASQLWPTSETALLVVQAQALEDDCLGLVSDSPLVGWVNLGKFLLGSLFICML